MNVQTRCDQPQGEMRTCPYCHQLYPPKRAQQEFCGDKCRNAYHIDVGTEGTVVGVTRLLRGRVSVVTHYESGPAAERAIQLQKGQKTRTVSK